MKTRTELFCSICKKRIKEKNWNFCGFCGTNFKFHSLFEADLSSTIPERKRRNRKNKINGKISDKSMIKIIKRHRRTKAELEIAKQQEKLSAQAHSSN